MSNDSLPILPVADLHCDLLSYLVRVKKASLQNTQDIGVALPYLEAGQVEMQTLAIFNPTESGCSKWGQKQVDRFVALGLEAAFHPIRKVSELKEAMADHKIGIVAAVENASGFCEEDEPMDFGFERLEQWINRVGRILYISLTHHFENRFGGGNFSDNVGLKEDGKVLLDWLDDRQICIDLAHASDQLAYDILDYTARYGLNIPIIASHSNFRPIQDHVRNLPDPLAKEIFARGGVIGINFLRDYVDTDDPQRLYDHIDYGWHELGGQNQLVLGADFFYLKAIKEAERHPLFHPEHGHAGQYPHIFRELQQRGYHADQLQALAHGNVLRFLEKVWR